VNRREIDQIKHLAKFYQEHAKETDVAGAKHLDDPTMTLIKESLRSSREFGGDVEFSGFAVKRLADYVDRIEAENSEYERRIAKAKRLLEAEMGVWLGASTLHMPDHYLQI